VVLVPLTCMIWQPNFSMLLITERKSSPGLAARQLRVRAVAKVFGVSGTVDSPKARITNKDGTFDGEGHGSARCVLRSHGRCFTVAVTVTVSRFDRLEVL